jgi:urease accessory protein
MLTISQRAQGPRRPDGQLELPFEARCRSRLRATMPNGEVAAIVMARGQVLRGGDLLLADDGRVIEVRAAAELVSTVRGAEPERLLRAAYHLGNRHVTLQIGADWLRYNHDHVLDDMVRGLGLRVDVEQAPFEPESGAYAPHEAARPHDHGGSAHGDPS